MPAELPVVWEGRNRRRIATLEPHVRPLARQFVEAALEEDILLGITEARRTPERQQKLYAQGRTAPGPIVTWTMKSRHLTGEAFDVGVLVDGVLTWPDDDALWERIGRLGERARLRWGGRWKKPDRPHFEAR